MLFMIRSNRVFFNSETKCFVYLNSLITSSYRGQLSVLQLLLFSVSSLLSSMLMLSVSLMLLSVSLLLLFLLLKIKTDIKILCYRIEKIAKMSQYPGYSQSLPKTTKVFIDIITEVLQKTMDKSREPREGANIRKKKFLVYLMLLNLLSDYLESFHQLSLLSMSLESTQYISDRCVYSAAHRCSQTIRINNLIIFQLRSHQKTLEKLKKLCKTKA